MAANALEAGDGRSLNDELAARQGDPAALERLYQRVRAEGNEVLFREALRQCLLAHPGDVLYEAWAYRLGVDVGRGGEPRPRRPWPLLIGMSVVLGLVSALLAGGRPPVPDPGEASPWFWVGWGPLVATGLMAYLAWHERGRRVIRYVLAAGLLGLVALYTGITLGDRADDAAILAALHLPFLSWAVVGAALCLGYPDPARQAYAYLVKSVEVVLTGGIFFGAGMMFVGLTYGIFAVIGVELPEEDLTWVAAWAVGALPLLAAGSVYDASVPPASQDARSGLTRTIRILARLLLPLALGVLVVYVLWFLPVYFRKPFEERNVLIVYNLTILAIMVLLTVVVSDPMEGRGAARSLFRYAVLGLGGLTLVLNVYALAAVTSRLLTFGLTPNRVAVVGWNCATLLIMAGVGLRLVRARRAPWLDVFRTSIGRYAPLAALWALALLLLLPWLPPPTP
ncbi:MAG: DUF4153 domain-containing protein [Rhodothermaceae bacterium]|nr:MAG: DUF4153 domain-containing protein [Rhodothermaceae bacterium]